MNVRILIDSIVRQTTVLIAQLATSGGLRAPLAHIANQVFLELTRELDAQGVSRKVSADMFGMALRSYLRRIQGLSESSTERGRTLWEAVLGYLSEGEVRSRGQVLKRFSRDEQNLVRGVLHDLTENGLVFSTGSGSEQVYRATTKAEQLQMGQLADASGLEELLWAFIYREGPLGRGELAEFAASNPERVDEALLKLAALGKIQLVGDEHGEGEQRRYRAERLEVLLEAEVGWEAAVFDHYRALVQTGKQLTGQAQARVGGSTFTLDVWDGHPFADEAYGVLARFRALHLELFERIERHNAEHGRPRDYDQVVIYFGQHCVPRRDSDSDEVKS
ncbi:MAG TPA: hypothetical protein VK509_12190 [Polyangiales bacterium]|nr:hypothetical protein [Polyangiales bacterium]